MLLQRTGEMEWEAERQSLIKISAYKKPSLFKSIQFKLYRVQNKSFYIYYWFFFFLKNNAYYHLLFLNIRILKPIACALLKAC